MWRPFFFDSNQAFGPATTKADWQRIAREYLDAYQDKDFDWLINNAMICANPQAMMKETADNPLRSVEYEIPNFGFRREHTGKMSLAEWAKMQEIDLTI